MNNECVLGMVGLGVMGQNLLLNMAGHGYAIAGYDKDSEKVAALRDAPSNVHSFDSLEAFIAALRPPRTVMMLVPAGAPVDAVIHDLLPHLKPGDCIIDGGNTFFKDTDRRQLMLAQHGVDLLGVGVSGGREGARHGPCIMPGGAPDAYTRVRPIFESIAAHVDGEACVGYIGPGSAGHFVKMVHNGIEYGIMRLIADVYDFMKRGLSLDDDELGDIFEQWDQGELHGFLVEITAQIFRKVDDRTGERLVDVVRDVARQKGTGMWTSQTAMELHVPVPTIDSAVAMRDLSVFQAERRQASRMPGNEVELFSGDRNIVLQQLHGALVAGTIITFAQGMALLHVASQTYRYDLDLELIARIWRGGCIIRAALLDPIAAAFRQRPDLPNPLLDSGIAYELAAHDGDLRGVVSAAAMLGIPVPGLMSALSYYDSYRSPWLPANLIEAQRDYFGSHGYERVDENGVFHTEWSL